MWKLLLIASLAHVSGGPLQNSPSSANWFSPSQFSGGACNCPSSSTVLDQDGSPVGANQPMPVPVPFGVSNAGTNFYQHFVFNGTILYARSPTVQPAVVTRDDYTYTPGIGAHKYHMKAVTWNDARKLCNEEGAHLAIINSVAEAQFLAKILNDSAPVTGTRWQAISWLGFHNFYNAGEWVTIFGKSLLDTGFQKWERGEPNNAGGQQHCGALYNFEGLSDMTCTEDFLPFICELIIA